MGIGDCLSMLGWTAYELGEMDATVALCREAEALCKQAGYAWGVQYAVYGLGLVARVQGDYAPRGAAFCKTWSFASRSTVPGAALRYTSPWGW